MTFKTEAELVAAFCAEIERHNALPDGRRYNGVWKIYHETAGFDLLLVDTLGVQIGIEAKLTLNAKVLEQILPHPYDNEGPDYRAVLVAREGLQLHLASIARQVGLTVIRVDAGRHMNIRPWRLPKENGSSFDLEDWFPWLPERRCTLPAYVPDVSGGKPSPVMLTPWKVSAIKLLILLERRGIVTRADMRHLQISPTRWTAAYHGFLTPAPLKGGYVRCERTPDYKATHPTNWAEIESDYEKWAPPAQGTQEPMI